MTTLFVKTLADEIADARNGRGWTQQELANKAGVSLAAVNRVEAGRTTRGPAITLIKVALGIGGYTIRHKGGTTLMKFDKDRSVLMFDSNVEQPPKPYAIPEWESEVAAGAWVDCITAQLDVDTQRDIIERGQYIIRISGDSMEPIYRSGDRVLFRIVRLDQEVLRIGADYCFQNSDGQCTLKRLAGVGEDEYVIAPLNAKRYAAMRVAKQQITQIAIVETIVRAPWET